ncbi:hypothetical protein O3P69_004493 [Scylla paramamosain]|uniref:Uncharacterized protein n=1 Tax=Scylla paramamosain TaxID=85552 RepID=A0AAW0UHR3_SCYPA
MPTYGAEHQKFYCQSDSPLLRSLGGLMKTGISLIEGLKRALVRNAGHLDPKKYIRYKILDEFTEADGSTRLYVSRGSVFSTPCGWPIPHDAPYKAQLNWLIVAILEAGLYDKWTADLMRETQHRSQRRQRQRQSADSQGQPESREIHEDGLPALTINHTQGAFIIFLLGLAIATLVFSTELL